MTLQQFAKDIKDKTLKNFYIFTGEEMEVARTYINKIAEVYNLEVKRPDSLSDIYSKLLHPTLQGKNSLYVIRDDMNIVQDSSILENMKNIQTESIVIFIYDSLDKRTKFYKSIEDYLVIFEKLDESVLVKHINRIVKLSKPELLARICEYDYSRILLETDKIKNYATSNNITENEAFNELVELKQIHESPENKIFEFIELVCTGKLKKALKLYDDLKQLEVNNLSIIALLYNNIRAMLLVQGSGDSKDIVSKTGLTPFQISTAKKYGNYYRISELTQLLRYIREIEKAVKTGTLQIEYTIDFIVSYISVMVYEEG